MGAPVRVRYKHLLDQKLPAAMPGNYKGALRQLRRTSRKPSRFGFDRRIPL
jgi:hypothetical protein